MQTTGAQERVFDVPVEVFAAWGQWAGGIGALLAVLVALGLAVFDARRLRRERRDNEAAQARTVLPQVRFARPPEAGPGADRIWAVFVDNHGTLPVTDVVVESVVGRFPDRTYTRWKASGDSGPVKLAAVIPPGGSVATGGLWFFDGVGAKEGVKAALQIGDGEHTVTVTFVDASGLRWRRQGTKPPSRILDKRR